MENAANNFLVTASPHVKGKRSVQSIMLDVIIALIPTFIIAVITFGFRAVLVVLVTVGSAVISEWLYQKLMKQKTRINDLSAVITGLILAFSIPVGVPLWLPVVGSFFAIVLVKQIFGGIGQNFMNPAMAGRAFLLGAYALPMTTFIYGRELLTDGTVGPTPLTYLYANVVNGYAWNVPFSGTGQYWWQMFLHNPNSALGEVSALALIAGGIYLVIRKVISLRMPLFFIAALALTTWIFRGEALFTGQPLFELALGGAMLGAFFIITDYSTSPMSVLGQIIFAVGVGALTGIIRLWATFPEGLSYAVLLMNLLVPLIDKFIKPRVYGTQKVKKEAA